MTNAKRLALSGALAAVAAVSILAVSNRGLTAADHLDAPTRTDPAFDGSPDRAADIADVFAWHTPTDVVVALTFAGPDAPGVPAKYDRDVLYTINVSNDGDPVTTEFPIEIRFGFDGNSPGVHVTGLPGGATISGPVETTLSQNGILVRAGLYDDPFFFDLQGFRETRSSGTLSFNNQRDFFRGQNDTSVVIQIPKPLIQNGARLINAWASTARFGGQL
jgi:hypothetical protein